jgi:hypothetical protein
LTKLKRLQKILLLVDLPLTKSDFCEALRYSVVFGANGCPLLDGARARAVAKDLYEEFISKTPDAKLEELTILFRREMIYDRGQCEILYWPVRLLGRKGKDEAPLITSSEDWVNHYKLRSF